MRREEEREEQVKCATNVAFALTARFLTTIERVL